MFAQVPAFILGILSCAAVTTTTFWNQWAISGPTSSDLLAAIWAWKYLFGECIQYQGGQFQCQEQESQFLLSNYEVAIQAMMIIAVFLSTLPCFGILFGMECTRILENKPRVKRKIMLASGLSYLASAIFTFASVVWFTIVTHEDFFSPFNEEKAFQWELGACIYLGYVGCSFCVLTFLACVCAPGQSPDDNKTSSFSAYEPGRYNPRSTSSRRVYNERKERHGSYKYTDYV